MSIKTEQREQDQQKAGRGVPVLPRVNLLPPEIHEAARLRRIQYGLGAAVLAAVGVVAVIYLQAAGTVVSATAEVEVAAATATTLQAESAKFAQVEAVYARAAGAQAMLTTAMGDEVLFSNYLNDLGMTLPENVWLKNVTITQSTVPPAAGATVPGIGTVLFVGVGYKHDDVAVWLEALAKQETFADPLFTNSTKALIGNREIVNFTSAATLTSEGLSGNYTDPAGG